MHFLNKEEEDKWIDNYVDRETAVASNRVQHAETAIRHEQEDLRHAEKAGSTTSVREASREGMLNAIEDCLSNLTRSYDEVDGEDEENDEEDTELCKLCDDDEPGWVMSTISKMELHSMETFWQKQLSLDELIQPGWGDAADYFRQRDMQCETA